MARIELDLARSGQLLRLLQILGQSLVDEAAHDGALLRAGHALPGHRRAGVQDGLLGHAGNHFARDAQADERRLRSKDAAERLFVRRFNLGSELGILELAQICGRNLVAARNGLPVHVHGRLLLADEILIEGLDAKVDHVQLFCE